MNVLFKAVTINMANTELKPVNKVFATNGYKISLPTNFGITKCLLMCVKFMANLKFKWNWQYLLGWVFSSQEWSKRSQWTYKESLSWAMLSLNFKPQMLLIDNLLFENSNRWNNFLCISMTHLVLACYWFFGWFLWSAEEESLSLNYFVWSLVCLNVWVLFLFPSFLLVRHIVG